MGILDSIHPRLLDAVPEFLFPSKATVYQPTVSEAADGQQKRTFTTALYTDVPCRLAPAVLTRNTGSEVRRLNSVTEVRGDWTLLLKGNYPLVTVECQVEVDGTRYLIVAPPQTDGNGILTKLAVATITPYAE